MEYLIFILKGLLIGLIVGFPSGPVGFIYIKRATTDGFLAGLISGLGSTFAHIFYVIVILYGYVELLEIFESYKNILTFVFSIFIIVLGFIIFNSKKNKIKKDNNDPEALYGYFLSALGITLTNPMEIVQFSFLFVLFEIFDNTNLHYIYLSLGVFMGSIFWPIISSLGISKIRNNIPERKIKYISKATGILIIIIGLFFVLKII